MTYKVAIGYNNAGSLVDIFPQPKTEKMEPGRIRISGEGLSIEDGYRSTELKFGFLTKAQMDALMASFGLTESVYSKKVTVALPRNLDRDFTNYNAIIISPTFVFDRGRYIEISFKIMRIVAI